MATLLQPTRVPAPGDKIIHELSGVASTGLDAASIARVTAPPGWHGLLQRPDFDEVSYVLAGELQVEQPDGQILHVLPGQAVHCPAGEPVRYSAGDGGADYLAVCAPAYTEGRAHREAWEATPQSAALAPVVGLPHPTAS